MFTLAQDVLQNVDPATQTLGSIAAIVTATLAIVQFIVKPLGDRNAIVNRIPTILYVLGISVGLTFLANRVLHTLPGDNLAVLIVKAVTMGLASQGLYVSTEAVKPLAVAKRTTGSDDPRSTFPLRLVPLLLIAALAQGCASSSAFYNGVRAVWPPISRDYNRYVDADTSLTPDERSIKHEAAATLDALIETEARRQQPSSSAPTTQP